MIKNLQGLAFVGLVAFVSSLPAFTQADAQLHVKDGMGEHQIAFESDLVGLRAFTPPSLTAKYGFVGIPVDYFYKSAKEIPEVRKALTERNTSVDSSSAVDVISTISVWNKSQGLIKRLQLERLWKSPVWDKPVGSAKPYLDQQFVMSPINVGEISPEILDAVKSYAPKFQPLGRYTGLQMKNIVGYDLNIIPGLLDTELMRKGKLQTRMEDLKGKKIQFLELNRLVAQDYSRTITAVNFLDDTSPHVRAVQFNAALDDVRKHPKLFAAATVKLATVSFGLPIVFRPDEIDANVPTAYSRDFDVYIVQFAMSDRRFFSEKVDEMAFIVRFPQTVIALELHPLSFGDRQSVEKENSTPPLKGKFGKAVEFELGSFIKQKVVFEKLRPTIVAQGLQENTITWLLRDDATLPGAKKFVAVVGVPKGMLSLGIYLSAFTKTKRFPGLQSNLASTDESKIEVKLPQN